jgi:Trk K+ transport system NAD-binding subunit
MEAEAVRGSPIVSGQLSEVSLPRGVLVGALRRNGELQVPRGTDRVEPGDRVLIIATTESAAKLTEFLTG